MGVSVLYVTTGALLVVVVMENLRGYGPAEGKANTPREKEKGSWVLLTRR